MSKIVNGWLLTIYWFTLYKWSAAAGWVIKHGHCNKITPLDRQKLWGNYVVRHHKFKGFVQTKFSCVRSLTDHKKLVHRLNSESIPFKGLACGLLVQVYSHRQNHGNMIIISCILLLIPIIEFVFAWFPRNSIIGFLQFWNNSSIQADFCRPCIWSFSSCSRIGNLKFQYAVMMSCPIHVKYF